MSWPEYGEGTVLIPRPKSWCDSNVSLKFSGTVLSSQQMLNSRNTFTESIKDAENLLAHFEVLNSHPPREELEVLKRAGLIMAMTARETYVEDRVYELTTQRLHNPDSQKTISLFHDYAGVDLRDRWCWNNFDVETVKTRLNSYLKLRGDVVPRSRAALPECSKSHPVKKEELVKAISFLKNLVDATELAIGEQCQKDTQISH